MPITFALVVLGVLLNANSAFALRCGTHLVSEGDSRGRVLHVCGEPTDISQRVEERFVREMVAFPNATQPTDRAAIAPTQADPHAVAPVVVSAGVSVVVESWTFNFGPDRAMQRVVFYDGVVHHIESLGRGYRPEDLGVYGRGVHLGETRDRVRATWGEPTETSTAVIERAVTTRLAPAHRPTLNGAPNIASGARVRVSVETWTYNLGPQRFMRRVIFEDGRVVAVDTLGTGY